LRLVRVAIGPLPLGQLRKGSVRPLTSEEKHALDQALRDKAWQGRLPTIATKNRKVSRREETMRNPARSGKP
jgi:hypothetical protein